MKSKRQVTLTQVKALYNAMRTAYMSSASMLVDDVFNAVKLKAQKLNVLCYYDCYWFREMFACVRAFKVWDLVDQQKLKKLVNEDLY